MKVEKNIIYSSEIIDTFFELDRLLLTTPASAFLKNHVFLAEDSKGFYENFLNFAKTGKSFSLAHFINLEKEITPNYSRVFFAIFQSAFEPEKQNFAFLRTLARLRSYLFGNRELIMEDGTFLYDKENLDIPFPPPSKIIFRWRISSFRTFGVPFLGWMTGLFLKDEN